MTPSNPASDTQKGVRVHVTDLETGDTDEAIVPTGDYLIIAVEPARYEVQAHQNGTHIITVKGRTRR